MEIQSKAFLSEFKFLGVIGEGSFGRVYLVQNKANLNLYALKTIKKLENPTQHQVNLIAVERDILMRNENPFITKLYAFFQSKNYVYFLLEHCSHENLSHLILREKKLSEATAKFYAGCLVLGIEYLHSKGIIYRDLKPENILIDKRGYAKIADFGLSEKGFSLDTKSFKFCGTINYMPPEMVAGIGHGLTADWWSLGVVIYEMLVGVPPFIRQRKKRLFKAIIRRPARLPDESTVELIDLLDKLLRKNPKNRIGCEYDSMKIKIHPWFREIDWEKLQRSELEPPIMPIPPEIIEEVTGLDEEFLNDEVYLGEDSYSSLTPYFIM